MKTAGLSE
jgi:ketosteroid isomerase-like protein